MLFESKYARLDKKRFVFYIKRRTFFICNASSVQADQKNKETPDFKGFLKKKNRAGDGNRTHVSSLEGWCSTIELHPRLKDK